ncbi:MAG: 4Fe-4S cluster-binding domain-containing protein [Lentimicrobiaceae bacterium]|nr:4Fe-4S cluster-binding domain-containing protein [Lentimicrobiaceae bacterium]
MRGESKKTREIFVMVTNQCNLACTYCYESVKNRQVIIPELAKKVITADIEGSRAHTHEYFLIFHGGEPFLAFNEMKEISEWAWATFPELKIICMVTTNGTLISPEIKTWLTINKQRFVPILSIDGSRASHNLNRSNSFDLIDRRFFRETWPFQPVKMTIAPNVLASMFDNFIALTQDGFIVNPSLAKEVGWEAERDLPVFAREMKKLADYFVEHPESLPCELINIPMQNFSPAVNVPHNRACGAGDNIVAYDVKGNRFPCHAFIGDPNQPYDADGIGHVFDLLGSNNGLFLSDGCRNCFIFSYCSPCYGLNYATRQNMGAFDPVMCKFNKIRVLAAADMFSRMLTSPLTYNILKRKSSEEQRLMLSGIQAVFKEVSLD